MAPAFWNTGYAGEAVEGLIGWAAEQGWRELTAEVFQDNPASVARADPGRLRLRGRGGDLHALARGTMVPSFLYRLDLAGGAGR